MCPRRAGGLESQSGAVRMTKRCRYTRKFKFSFRSILSQKNFADFSDFQPIFGNFFLRFFFGSKSAEMKILLCKLDMGNKLYKVNFFDLFCKKLELMKQNHLLKIGFVIFLKGAKFSNLVESSGGSTRY